MKDLIVTTPKTQIKNAAAEARQCIEQGGGFYFRTFRIKPKDLRIGSKIFYVEDGFIRGYGVVSAVKEGEMTCSTTGINWGKGCHAIIPADSWTWISPIAMKGFQGWRYFDANSKDIVIVGHWKDSKPVPNT